MHFWRIIFVNFDAIPFAINKDNFRFAHQKSLGVVIITNRSVDEPET